VSFLSLSDCVLARRPRGRRRALLGLLIVVAGPVVRADTQRAIAAFNRQDYAEAWREFMTSAERGDPAAQAGVGMMLFERLNPPGTGQYADCERWLRSSATQGNAEAMTLLGRFYYADAVRTAQAADARLDPGGRRAASLRYIQARDLFERASRQGDADATARLADMVDAGLGGARDVARAVRLRAEAAKAREGRLALRPIDPAVSAMRAAWQAGRYADALAQAQPRAADGDMYAQALLGRAYYEGVGVPQNYAWALSWLEKALAQGSADAMFFLGLMYEHGRGVAPSPVRALEFFDRAAALGQGFAAAEQRGMRSQVSPRGTSIQPNRSVEDNACFSAGGVPSAGTCTKGGRSIDPYGP
jgi:TPR repeat protein